MAFLDKSKANYAFKALLGKAHTSAEREFANESILSGVVNQASRIWADTIDPVASNAVTDGVVTQLTGVSLEIVSGAVAGGIQSSYRLRLGGSVPAGLVGKINPITGLEYAANDYIGNVIPDAFGVEGASDYRPILYNNGTEVPPLDASDWFIDPFSGVVTREGDADSSVAWAGPMTMDCYIYVGQTVTDAIGAATGFTPLSGEGITLTPSGSDYIFSVSDYISSTEVASVSAGLQTQIDNNYSIIQSISGASNTELIGGTGIQVIESPTDTWTLSISGDYATTAFVVGVSGDLQNQIDSLSAASSGGVASINNVINAGGNIDLVTTTSEVSITPNDGANQIAIDVDLSGYATTTTTNALSAAISTNASDISTLQGASYVNTIEGLTGTVDISGAGGISVIVNGNTITLSGSAQYTDEMAQDAVGTILTDTNSVNFTYDDGTPQITADVIVNSDSLEINGSGVRLKDTVTGNRTFSNDITINGNLYVNGNEFIVNTTTVSASDNIIVINGGEAGAGVTSGFAGIQVDRGTETDYQFLFRESDDTFVIGISGDLQAVATREDSPIIGGLAIWNDTASRFDTISTNTLADSISGSFVIKSGDIMTGTLQVPDLDIGSGSVTSTQAVSENPDVDTGTEVVDSFASNLAYSAMWIVSIRSLAGTDIRTSTVTGAWDGTTIEYNEVSTNDIGNTTDISLDVILSGGNVQLRAITLSDNWIVKTHRIML